MKNYDLDKIRSMVSIEDVIYRLGIETKQMGRRMAVLCPMHSDTHFGSAYVVENGIYCFTCNQYYDIFSIYMHMFHMTFHEAVEAICDTYSVNAITEDSREMCMPFKRYELKLLGLLNGKGQCYYPLGIRYYDASLRGYIMKKENIPLYNSHGKMYGMEEYYTISRKGKTCWMMLNDLYQEERDTFKELLLKKCSEAYGIFQNWYCVFREIWIVIPECRENIRMMWECLKIMYEISLIHQRVKEL